MSVDDRKPVILLTFANDRLDGVRYLRNLPEEARRLRAALEPAESAGLCELVIRQNATAADVLDVLQDARYRDRVAVFHFGGHADGYRLLLESAAGRIAAADASGLAAFLGRLRGLRLVFLNGCSTGAQARGLLESGVAAVVATSQAIDDAAAVEFAARFYRALGAGAAVRRAFNEAVAAVALGRGEATRDFSGDLPDEPERLPWHLQIGEGAELAAEWSLPEAAGDPLFGLPALAQRDLPENPFLEPLAWYTREHAEVFFGRGYQIREMFERVVDPGGPPIVLLYGRSGMGKSSLLAAGLQPRLEAAGYASRYLRRDQKKGLLATLREALTPSSSSALAAAWRAAETAIGQPLVVVLDQVEESLTRTDTDRPQELAELIAALAEAFVRPDDRPRGKLVLGFRMEWLAVIERRLSEALLPRAKMFLEPLDRQGIIEAVRGPARLTAPGGREIVRPVISRRLEVQYRLEIADDLPGLIADDLLNDRDSLVAPTLQILLNAMWEKARAADAARPRFDRALYEDLRKKGILLGDFLERQLTNLRAWRPDAVDAGLVLDLLEFYTTPLGSARERSAAELTAAFGHIGLDLPALLERCNDLYLLTDLGRGGEAEIPTMRLAHDTLAPLVRERFDRSDRPAQRARRILRNRLPEWEGCREGAPLEERDLVVVEAAVRVMRAWSVDEHRLVEASRRARDRGDTDRCRLRAESLLRALGHAPGPIDRIELIALWDLASLPASEERVRSLVVQRALEEAGTTEQIANRLAPFVHAAVGLSPARRRAIIDEVVLPALRKPALDPRIAWTCARIGVSLAADGEEFLLLASEALAALAEACDVPCDLEALTLARRVSSEVAERVGQRLLLDVAGASALPDAHERSTDMLDAVGPRLSLSAAEPMASGLVEAMTQTRDSHQLARLAKSLSAVGSGLSAAMSARVADWLVEVMTHAGDLDDLCRLAGGLEAMRNWLPTAVAARAFATLAVNRSDFEIVRVAHNLEQIGPRLPAPDADRAAERIVAAMSGMSDRGALETLTRGLEAVVPRLTASATVRAALQLAASLARVRVAAAIRALTGGFRALAKRLPAADVEHFVERAADRLIDAMLEACKPEDLRCLAEGLGELAPFLTPGSAETRLAALGTARTPVELLRLAQALAVLGPRLPASEGQRVAERVVERLFEAVAKFGEPDDLRYLAEAIKTVVPALSTGSAARVTGRVIDIMAATGDGLALKELVDGLAYVPGYLDVATMINLLKFPICVGPPRDSLLRSLETGTGKTFGGDVWRLVEQASELGLAPDALVTPPTRRF
jgi:hypothetical protein